MSKLPSTLDELASSIVSEETARISALAFAMVLRDVITPILVAVPAEFVKDFAAIAAGGVASAFAAPLPRGELAQFHRQVANEIEQSLRSTH